MVQACPVFYEDIAVEPDARHKSHPDSELKVSSKCRFLLARKAYRAITKRTAHGAF
jgi:hypothetical protein